MPSYNKPKDFKISLPILTSSTGFFVSETLIVSPIPMLKRVPMPMEDFTQHLKNGPASVTPKCKG